MATQTEIQTITTQAIFDNAFRARLLKSPKKAAAELKITLTAKEAKYIKSLDPAELDAVAKEVRQLTHTDSGLTHWA